LLVNREKKRSLIIVNSIVWAQSPSALLFIVGCNVQVFSPKPWKKFRAPCCRLREKRKNRITPTHSILKKMTSPSRRLLPAVITS